DYNDAPLRIKAHTTGVISVAWNFNDSQLVSGGYDNAVRLWNASNGQPIATLQGHTDRVVQVAFSPNGAQIASASWDGTVRVWDSSTHQIMQVIQVGVPVGSVAWSPDSTKLAYGGAGGTVQIVNAPTVPVPTSGLLGQYYDNIDLTNWKLNRVDNTVNFNWIQGSPDPLIGADTFSIRWTGQVIPLYSQTYTFYTQTDDGVRLWVNNQQLINDWTNHGTTEFSGTIALTANTKYNIRMEYYDSSNAAEAHLSWSSSSQAKQIIPTDRILPNGRIVFQTNRDGNDEIYSMNADGSSPVNLTSDSGSDTNPAVYTGTQQILFASSRTGNYEIDRMALTGGAVTNLTNVSSFDQYPSQAPDGRIAFASTRGGGNFNLWMLSADGQTLTQLTTTTTDVERYSSWSPDGQWIVYDSEVGGVQDLWKISAAGGTPIRLTQNVGSNSTPSWSPDGTTIVFHTTRNAGANEIYLMDTNNVSNQRPFKTGGLNGFEPVWSPDGTSISYHAWANGQPEVYTIPLGAHSSKGIIRT
ncbi:MAG TPA: PA14 domain-containing protein, partial [Terriglobales bacterium]|nr:PA14 domain-containing protein [Terriglobales bacterium]